MAATDNSTLRSIGQVIVCMQHLEPTKAYVAHRTTERKNKRYVIREVYQLIKVNPRTGEITS
jgi:hypothetical protein